MEADLLGGPDDSAYRLLPPRACFEGQHITGRILRAWRAVESFRAAVGLRLGDEGKLLLGGFHA